MRFIAVNKRPTMLVALVLSLSIGPVSALELSDITDKTKPVYTNVSVTATHQRYIGTIFRYLSDYLCIINQNRYEKYANFMGGIEGDVIAYRVQGNEPDCGLAKSPFPQIVRATQPTPDSDMVVEHWSRGGEGVIFPLRLQAKISEEASEANPFGVLEMNVQVLSSGTDPETVYRFRSTSDYLDSGSVDVKVAMYLDQIILDNTQTINTEAQFFSAAIEHQLDNSGAGTIVVKFFGPDADPRLYPEGIPNWVRAFNVAYDSEFLRYSVRGDLYAFGGYIGTQIDEGDFCIRRNNPWTYVDRFGIYDSAGEQNTEVFTATYTADDGTVHSLNVNGMDYTTAGICRAWSDGSDTGETVDNCSGISKGNEGGELRNVELPNFAEIVRDDGAQEHYLVRRLLTRRVYEQVAAENCAGLTLPATKAAPNHRFFSEGTLLDFSWPAAGAVLVNAFEETPEDDPSDLAGGWYRPWEDSDDDGVLNYLDAFPDDPTKSADLDYDGIDDEEDTTDDRIVYDHADIDTPDAVEYITPSMAQP